MSLNDLFASRNETDSLDERIEAISRLFVETLRTLQTKNKITADEVEGIFERVDNQSIEDVGDYVDVIYLLLNPPNDQEDEELPI